MFYDKDSLNHGGGDSDYTIKQDTKMVKSGWAEFRSVVGLVVIGSRKEKPK